MTGPAPAQEPPDTSLVCGEDPYAYFTRWEKRLRAKNPGDITRAEITGEHLAAVLDGYNSYPPQSYLTADVAYSYMKQGVPNAVLVFVDPMGCVVASGQIGIGMLLEWLRIDVKGNRPMLLPGMHEA